MKFTREQFRRAPNKAVTLLGMSGVGKTTLACLLPKDKWFHYSGDYRIGTRYLEEAMLDDIKQKAMRNHDLAQLLKHDRIYIRNNISVHNLESLSFFLGKIGRADLGGLSAEEFKRRQLLFRRAEQNAMRDVGDFIRKGREIYGYPHFLNDAGGSICGFNDDECWRILAEQTLVLYLRADEAMEEELIARAKCSPKPLNYDEAFLAEHLPAYLRARDLRDADQIEPDDFVQWAFAKLIAHRKPQYEAIAAKHGYTIDAKKISEMQSEADFIDLVCEAIGA